jgi:hypothetical protein
MAHFDRDFLRVLRGLADGSYDEWIRGVEDLCRLRFETFIYIDRDGVVSSTGGHGMPDPRASAKTTDPQGQIAVPPTKQGAEQLNTEPKVTGGAGHTQRNEFSPIDFLANSTSFSFGTPVSSLARDEPLGQPPKLDGSDMSSLLPMEFIMYNDLMTDIGGTTRFFDQDFRSSVLFGSAPAPPVTMEGVGSVQGREFQTSGTMYR